MSKKTFMAAMIISALLVTTVAGMQVVEVTQANFVPIPTTPPSVLIVNPLNSSTQPKNTVVEFNVTVPNAWLRVIFSYSLDDQPLVEIQLSELSRTSVDQWRFTLQNVSDGPHTLKVSVKIGKTESTDYDRTWQFVGLEGVSSLVNFTVDGTQISIPTPTLNVSLYESASALNYGNTVNFTVLVDGGTKPYTFAWYIDNQLAETSGSQYFSTDSQAVGSHHVYVQVTDADNNSATTLTVEFNVLQVSNTSPGVNPNLSSSPTRQPTLEPSQSSTPTEGPFIDFPVSPLEVELGLIVLVLLAFLIAVLVYIKKIKKQK